MLAPDVAFVAIPDSPAVLSHSVRIGDVHHRAAGRPLARPALTPHPALITPLSCALDAFPPACRKVTTPGFYPDCMFVVWRETLFS